MVNCNTAGVVCWGKLVVPSNEEAIDRATGGVCETIPVDAHDAGRAAGGGVGESGAGGFDTRPTTSETISFKMLSIDSLLLTSSDSEICIFANWFVKQCSVITA